MFLIKSKKNRYMYACVPQFYYIKVGFEGYSLHGHVFLMLIVGLLDLKVCVNLTPEVKGLFSCSTHGQLRQKLFCS